MAGITLTQAEERLSLYLDAETKVLQGQSYRIGERQLTRADLSEIRAGIDIWDARVKALSETSSGRGRSVNLAPRW